jgi:hypothetical protein
MRWVYTGEIKTGYGVEMVVDKSRFQLQNGGVFIKAYDKLVGAKIAVAYYARRYRSFGYRAVDTQTGETWRWDHEVWHLVKIDPTLLS